MNYHKAFVRFKGGNVSVEIPIQAMEDSSYECLLLNSEGDIVTTITSQVNNNLLNLSIDSSLFSALSNLIIIVKGSGFPKSHPLLFLDTSVSSTRIFTVANKVIADILQSDYSIIELDEEEALFRVFQCYLETPFNTLYKIESEQLLYVVTMISVLKSVLNNILTREIAEAPEIKIDDSKLAYRIQYRLIELEKEKVKILNTIDPDNALKNAEENLTPVVVSEVYRIRQGEVIPGRLSETLSIKNLNVQVNSDICTISWDSVKNEDFQKYFIETLKDDGTVIGSYSIYDNLQNKFTFKVSSVSKINFSVVNTAGQISVYQRMLYEQIP